MDTELEASLKTYEVSFALLPLVSKSQPKAQGAASDSPAAPKNQTTYGSAKGGKKATFRPKPYSAKGKGKGKSQSKGFQKKSGKLEVPHRLLMVHQFVLILLSNVVAKLWLKDPVARRDTTYAAFAMGRCV